MARTFLLGRGNPGVQCAQQPTKHETEIQQQGPTHTAGCSSPRRDRVSECRTFQLCKPPRGAASGPSAQPPPLVDDDAQRGMWLGAHDAQIKRAATMAFEGKLVQQSFAPISIMLSVLRAVCRAHGARALSSQALPITTVRVSNDSADQRKFLAMALKYCILSFSCSSG
jgi:hypothetical protein